MGSPRAYTSEASYRRGFQHGFNPRARTGRDTMTMMIPRMTCSFNPRARTGRDPQPPGQRPRNRLLFQSTRPHGARPEYVQDLIFAVSFQSTRPHGARQRSNLHLPPSICFNPRARTGRDPWHVRNQRAVRGFNPRARTGRDRYRHADPRWCPVSIHAPARGATPAEAGFVAPLNGVSIHAPARGYAFGEPILSRGR